MNLPRVSVVIPSYNRGYCIGDCITSALTQDYPDLEVIVVDDASSDDTRARVASIDDPRVRYVVHENNCGGSAARNTGIRHASGDYIAFLDSDDRWLPNKLERQMHGLLARGAAYGLSYTWFLCVDAQGRETMRINPDFEDDCTQQILISNFIGTFSNVIVRRDLLAQVDGLDEGMKSCQDWDLFIRLLRVTRVHCQREYLLFYLQNGSDAVRISLNPRSVVQGHCRILSKFADAYRALPRARRREALHVYFNAFVRVGAFGEAVKMSDAILCERASPSEFMKLLRGLMRAARRALVRLLRTHNLRVGGAVR